MTVKNSPRRLLTAVLAAVLLAGAGTGLLLGARPAHSIIAILIGLRQGPMGVGRGQAILIGLLLPAVQKVQVDRAYVGLKLYDATTGATIGTQTIGLLPGGPARFMHLEVLADGSVRFNRKGTNLFVREGQVLQIAVEGTSRVPEGTEMQGVAQIHSFAGDGSVVPTDQFSLNFTEIR